MTFLPDLNNRSIAHSQNLFLNSYYSIKMAAMRQPSYRKLKPVLKLILDALFPAGCLKCAEPINTPGNLCAKCWPTITFLSTPCCTTCGYPFEFDGGLDLQCGNCLRTPPPFRQARSVLKYDAHSRDMILAFKHADQTDRGPSFATWMYRTAPKLVDNCDYICPVPLHPYRLMKRRFNQSALLAIELSKLTGRPAIPDLLKRTRPTRSQGTLSATARHKNVKGAFRATSRHFPKIENARILLIDDVYTTGATVEACSNSLLTAGAQQVDVLTFCRVVRTSNVAI